MYMYASTVCIFVCAAIFQQIMFMFNCFWLNQSFSFGLISEVHQAYSWAAGKQIFWLFNLKNTLCQSMSNKISIRAKKSQSKCWFVAPQVEQIEESSKLINQANPTDFFECQLPLKAWSAQDLNPSEVYISNFSSVSFCCCCSFVLISQLFFYITVIQISWTRNKCNKPEWSVTTWYNVLYLVLNISSINWPHCLCFYEL